MFVLFFWQGNGGVLLPALHLGRDAPVAAALVLAWLRERGESASQAFGGALPRLFMCKLKAAAVPRFEAVLARLAAEYAREPANTVNREDGLRVDTREGWIHLRASNTEPVYRVIGEWSVSAQDSLERCNALLERVAAMSKAIVQEEEEQAKKQ